MRIDQRVVQLASAHPGLVLGDTGIAMLTQIGRSIGVHTFE
jgi:hypothetical protein